MTNISRPNIVVISVDTLRGDYFSPEYMPLTFGWASDSCLIYTNAYSNSTWTKPSYVTLLTGLSQQEHGVEYMESVLGESIPTLPGRLHEMGYFTCAFTNGGYVSKRAGMSRGFDLWREVPIKTYFGYHDLLVAPFEESKSGLLANEGKPVFCLLHTYYVHEWYADVSTRPKPGSRKDKQGIGTSDIELPHVVHAERAEEMIAKYGETVRRFDVYLDGYLQWLLSSPLADNLWIIVTSDHGESLYELHEGNITFGHSWKPYREQVHIPLAVYGPGQGTSNELVCVKDLYSIIQEIADSSSVRPRYHSVLEASYLSERRDVERKLRSSALITASGELELRTIRGSESWDDNRTPTALSQEQIEELQALGYTR